MRSALFHGGIGGREAFLCVLAKWRNLCHIPHMKREFNVVIERDSEGFYVASLPELHGCHTQARSLDKLVNRIKETIALCREVEDSGLSAWRGGAGG